MFLFLFFTDIFDLEDKSPKHQLFFSKADQALRVIEDIDRQMTSHSDFLENTFREESLLRSVTQLKNDLLFVQSECQEHIAKRLEHYMLRILNDIESFMNPENLEEIRFSSFLKLKSDTWKTREIIEHAVKRRSTADASDHRRSVERSKKLLGYSVLFYLILISLLSFFLVWYDVRNKKVTDYKNAEELSNNNSETVDMLKEVQKKYNREQIINKRKSALLDTIPVGIFASDPSGRITFINRQVSDWFEIKENLIGENIEKIFLSFNVSKSTEKFLFNGNIYVLTSYEDGDETFFIVRNVTDSEEMSRKLLDSERLVSIGEMASRITHEIRNPLSTIKLNSEYLAENVGDLESSQISSSINLIVKEVERLEQITGKYMNMVKYSTREEVEVHTTLPVDLVEFVSFHTAEFSKRGIEIKIVNCDDVNIPMTLSSFKEIMLNLFKNAWEELGSGEKVHVSVAVKDLQAVIVVEDSGGGIPENEREQVFKNFYTKKPGGTGIGLSHSRKLAVETGGKLYAADSLLGGVAMILELPVKKI